MSRTFRPVSAFLMGGLTAAVGLAAALLATSAPIAMAHMGREPLDGLTPVICQADGTLTVSGVLNGRAGVWFLAGTCIQTGDQEPACVPFLPYGSPDAPCVLAEYASEEN